LSSNQKPPGTVQGIPERATAGQAAIIMLGLTLGLIMMGIQLWLLTLAFDLFRSGDRTQTLVVAIFSGVVFLGGVLMLRFLDRGPRVKG